MRWLFAGLLLLGLIGPVRADEADRDLARKHYEIGLMLFQRGQYADALRELHGAKLLIDRPELDYNIGLCLAKLGRAGEAADSLQRFVDARPDDVEAPNIRTRIAELRVQEQKDKAEPAPRPYATPPPPAEPQPPAAAPPQPPPPAAAPPVEPVPPGVAALPDKTAATPSDFGRFAKSGRGAAAFSILGVGTASLIAGVATGATALSRRRLYDDSCNLGMCDHSEWEAAHGLGIATDVLLAVGFTGVAVFTIIVLTRPHDTHKVAATHNGLEVRF